MTAKMVLKESKDCQEKKDLLACLVLWVQLDPWAQLVQEVKEVVKDLPVLQEYEALMVLRDPKD